MPIKYTYSQQGYRPKDVSFEVAAMLLDEEKDGYGRERERAFNPLSDEKDTEKYVEHEHEFGHASEIINEKDFKNKGKKQSRWMLKAKHVFHLVKEAFEAVIQNMLVNEVVAEKILEEQQEKHQVKVSHKSFLEVKEVNKIIHTKGLSHVEDIEHNHVYALKHEQARVRYRSR